VEREIAILAELAICDDAGNVRGGVEPMVLEFDQAVFGAEPDAATLQEVQT
jgi:hypothetical protein